MIGVVAYWETFTGVENPIYKAEIWKDTLKPFGATHLFFIDEEKLNPTCPDRDIIHKNYPSLTQMLKEHKTANFVLLIAERNLPPNTPFTNIKNFIHPKDNVIYVFGKDSNTLNPKDFPSKNRQIVTISTFEGLSLWSIVTTGIVLFDRQQKENK